MWKWEEEVGDGLSTPAASSPRPWIKMKAAELEILEASLEAGTMMGGLLSAGIVNSLALTETLATQ